MAVGDRLLIFSSRWICFDTFRDLVSKDLERSLFDRFTSLGQAYARKKSLQIMIFMICAPDHLRAVVAAAILRLPAVNLYLRSQFLRFLEPRRFFFLMAHQEHQHQHPPIHTNHSHTNSIFFSRGPILSYPIPLTWLLYLDGLVGWLTYNFHREMMYLH